VALSGGAKLWRHRRAVLKYALAGMHFEGNSAVVTEDTLLTGR